MLFTYKKNEIQSLSLHFKTNEFQCPCSGCKSTLIDSELVEKLELLRKGMGTKLQITSAYRCPDKQKELRILGYETAKGISQHCLGKAADVTNGVARGAELEEEARKAGFKSVGVGKTWIHVDLRPEERRWFYAKR